MIPLHVQLYTLTYEWSTTASVGPQLQITENKLISGTLFPTSGEMQSTRAAAVVPLITGNSAGSRLSDSSHITRLCGTRSVGGARPERVEGFLACVQASSASHSFEYSCGTTFGTIHRPRIVEFTESGCTKITKLSTSTRIAIYTDHRDAGTVGISGPRPALAIVRPLINNRRNSDAG